MRPIKLRKPIDAHGKELTELEMKEPTTGDLIDCGDPMVIGVDETVSFKNDVIARYISKLSGVPMSSVRELSPADFMECKTVITGFLV